MADATPSHTRTEGLLGALVGSWFKPSAKKRTIEETPSPSKKRARLSGPSNEDSIEVSGLQDEDGAVEYVSQAPIEVLGDEEEDEEEVTADSPSSSENAAAPSPDLSSSAPQKFRHQTPSSPTPTTKRASARAAAEQGTKEKPNDTPSKSQRQKPSRRRQYAPVARQALRTRSKATAKEPKADTAGEVELLKTDGFDQVDKVNEVEAVPTKTTTRSRKASSKQNVKAKAVKKETRRKPEQTPAQESTHGDVQTATKGKAKKEAAKKPVASTMKKAAALSSAEMKAEPKEPIVYSSALDDAADTKAGAGKSADKDDAESSEAHYNISRLVKHRVNPDADLVELLVEWVGQPSDEATWEPEADLHADAKPALIRYWDAQPGGRNKVLRDSGHTCDVFALWGLRKVEAKKKAGRKASKSKAKKEAEQASWVIDVEWVGYKDTSPVYVTSLEEDQPELMDLYWQRVKRPVGL